MSTVLPRTQSKLRRRLRRWAIAFGFLLLFWFFGSLYVSYRLTHRPRPWFAEPAPRVTWGPIESHRIKTSDGQELGAWFVDSPSDSPSVLVLHGNRGSRRDSLGRAQIFRSADCAVLLISLRAHGDSSGDNHDVGLRLAKTSWLRSTFWKPVDQAGPLY